MKGRDNIPKEAMLLYCNEINAYLLFFIFLLFCQPFKIKLSHRLKY